MLILMSQPARSQNASQDLKIDAARPALAGVSATGELSGQQTSTAQKGNTIHMVFKSVYTASLNCVGVTRLSGLKSYAGVPGAVANLRTGTVPRPTHGGGAAGGGGVSMAPRFSSKVAPQNSPV